MVIESRFCLIQLELVFMFAVIFKLFNQRFPSIKINPIKNIKLSLSCSSQIFVTPPTCHIVLPLSLL